MRKPSSLLNRTLLAEQLRNLSDDEAATVWGGATTTTTTVQYTSGIWYYSYLLKYYSYYPTDPI